MPSGDTGVFLGVLAAVLVSGCGGSRHRFTVASRFSAADLPAGWSAVAASASPAKVTNAPCLSRLANKPMDCSYESPGLRRRQIDPQPR